MSDTATSEHAASAQFDPAAYQSPFQWFGGKSRVAPVEHEMPDDWRVHKWSAQGGMANTARSGKTNGKANRHKERLWLSPHCLESA